MGSTELVANLFRITQTDDKLRRLQEQGVAGKTVANQTHYEVGREVRGAIERIGGTLPEDLPTPAESIQQIEKREQQRVVGKLQSPLFPADAGDD
jgi:DNA-damage-inducible protein D